MTDATALPAGYNPDTGEAIYHAEELRAITAALEAAADTALRHPVIRTGERPPIDPKVRFAVYSRDGNTCRICRQWVGDTEKHLDHILPWSAGGSDRSTNLRTTCAHCNLARSNYRDNARSEKPITWWCTDCWSLAVQQTAHWTYKIDLAWRRESSPLIEPDVCDELVLAFCAFCGVDGYTTPDRLM